MSRNIAAVGLDVGTKRIGVAICDGSVMIARPLTTIEVDGKEMEQIVALASTERAATFVIGYPRNQAGGSTAQTRFVEDFARRLAEMTEVSIVFQDESLTSVVAEDRLRVRGKPYSKDDIDAEAATLILQDYLEQHSGRV